MVIRGITLGFRGKQMDFREYIWFYGYFIPLTTTVYTPKNIFIRLKKGFPLHFPPEMALVLSVRVTKAVFVSTR